jgi:hypothetical protein
MQDMSEAYSMPWGQRQSSFCSLLFPNILTVKLKESDQKNSLPLKKKDD